MKKTIAIILVFLLIPLLLYFLHPEYPVKLRCYLLGKTPVYSDEIGMVVHNPQIVCAQKTPDANEKCFDSDECNQACILERYSYGYQDEQDFINKNGEDKIGYCQPFLNMDCFVERKKGKIILHVCPIE